MNQRLEILPGIGLTGSYRRLVALIVPLLLVACAGTPPAAEPMSQTADDSQDWYSEALHWTRTSAEHRAILEQTFKLAAQRIEVLAAGRAPGTWAIAADADETLVDNSQYDLEVKRAGEEFNTESWHAWVRREAAPALPGAVAFIDRVKALGGVVAVVTNRRTEVCAPTARNLKDVGIAFDVVLCREEDGQKEPRWDAVAAGQTTEWPEAQFSDAGAPGPVEILMWLGDNIGDFPDLDQSARQQPGELEGFGDRFIALPNPMYGSWEDNPKQ